MVVVDGVSVDMPEHMPQLAVNSHVVEVGAREYASLHPERLRNVEGGVVELLEARLPRDEHVPLNDGECIVLGEVLSHLVIKEQLVELHRRALGVNVILSPKQYKKTGRRTRKQHILLVRYAGPGKIFLALMFRYGKMGRRCREGCHCTNSTVLLVLAHSLHNHHFTITLMPSYSDLTTFERVRVL